MLATVISSSLADKGTRTSKYRISCDIVEIRCDWTAIHTALQKDIDPSSAILLKSVRQSDRRTQKSRTNYDSLATTSIFKQTMANLPLDKTIDQYLLLLLPMINFLQIHLIVYLLF